jgi:O-antigen ligase
VLLGIAFASALPPEVRSRVGTLAGMTTGGPDPLRLAVWHDSLRLAASSPALGSGFGAFADALPRFKTALGDHRVEHAESDYLELLAEGGLAAGALVGLLIASVLSAGRRGLRDEPHRAARGLRAGALGGVTALLVHNAFDFNLRIPSNALLFGLLLAMVLGPATHGGESASGAPLRRAWLRAPLPLLLMTAIALVLGLTNPWVPRRLDATPLVRAAASPATALRWRSLEGAVVEHLRRRPADAPAWVTLAWLRAPASPAEAAALASWGVLLDPEHAALHRAAERVAGAQIQPRRP